MKIKFALGWVVVCLVAQQVWGGFIFPASKDLAQEWVIQDTPPAAPPGGGAVYARVDNFHQYLLVIPEQALGVWNEKGEVVPWCVQGLSNSTAFSLIFEYRAGHRYFTCWNSKQVAVPQVQKRPKAKPGKTKKSAKSSKIEIPGLEDLPDGELDLTQGTSVFVRAQAGGLTERLPWSVREGVVRQVTRDPNVFLVTKSEWGDSEVTVKVRPLTCQLAGISVRAPEPTRLDGGLYWLVGVEGVNGDNKIWGLVRDDGPGPLLKTQTWNEVKIRITGTTATLTLNGQVHKQLELPEEAPVEGCLGLATYGGEAEFDDLKVTDPSSGKTLLADGFDGAGLDSGRWHNVEGLAQGGFFRIVNNGDAPAAFNCRLAFHRDPWSRAVSHQPAKLPGKQASAWMWLPNLYSGAPVTLMVSAPVGSEGEVLVARAMNTEGLIDRFRVTDTNGLTLEALRSDFTERAQLQTDGEIGAKTLADVKAMTFRGKRPERFPTGFPSGHPLEYEAGRVLGFTAVGGPPQSLSRELMDRLGYRYIDSYTHLATSRGQGSGFKKDLNRLEMDKLAEQFRSRNLLDRVYRISVFDEPGFDIAVTMGAKPGKKKAAAGDTPPEESNPLVRDTNAWGQMIANAGLVPADLINLTNPPPKNLTVTDLDYWRHLRLRTIEDRAEDPVGVYRTMGVHLASYATRFGNIRAAIRESFGTQVWVTANVHDSHFMKGLPVDIDPWMLYSRLEALDVPQACDYTVGYPPAEEFMIDLFRCALRPHQKPVDAYLASQARYMTRSPRSLKLRAFSALGAGAQSLTFYNWGPRYKATENWYDTDRGKLQVIGEINHAAGWVEDILMDGAPRRPKVALLWTRSGDIWDAIDVGPLFAQERKMLHHLLRNLQYQADILHDEDLPPAQELDHYQVIFMTQRCLSPAGEAALTAWVERGGTLIASFACAPLDELAKPTDRMLKAFGVKQLELPTVLSTKTSTTQTVAGLSLVIRGPIATVTPGSARVTATFEDGRPAVLERSAGKGLYRMTAFLIGHSYHSGESLGMKRDVLLGMNETLRDLIRPWLAPAGEPFCATDQPLISARLIESPHGAAVFLVNATGEESVGSLTVTLHGIQAETAESLAGGPLEIEPVAGGGIRLRLAGMGLTDVIRIR